MTKLTTRAVRAGIDCDPAYGAVTPPIVLSANFTFEEFGKKRAYDYGRSGNPTRDQLANALADLEGGAGGIITSTGMSAIALVLQALLKPGDRVLIPHDCYGGTWRLFKALAERGAFELEVVDFTDAELAQKALATNARLIWLENSVQPAPSNHEHLGGSEDCESRWRDRRRRQYVPVACATASDRAWGGCRHPLDHEVHQRPQRCGRWGSDRRRPCCAGRARLVGERDRPRWRAVRLIPHASRASNA